MDRQVSNTHNLQWKWVVITLAMYLILYFLPFLLTEKLALGTGYKNLLMILTIWKFVGILIVAAVAGYLSKGVTILEPALAGISMIVLWITAFVLFFPGGNFDVRKDTLVTIEIMAFVFVSSLFGAWLGERAQRLWKSDKS